MLLRIETRTKIDRMGRAWHSKCYVVACDECGLEFVYPRTVLRRMQFCSKDCLRASSSAGKVRAARETTMIEQHGCATPLTSEFAQTRARETSHTEAACLKREQTCLERFGSSCALGNKEMRAQGVQTQITKYGDLFVRTEAYRVGVDWAARNAKLHATMKASGKYTRSRPEESLYTCLCQKFGVDNVERQAIAGGWMIDFKIKLSECDVFVQLDGVYWHGLDRPIAEISQSSAPRDVVICKKYATDRAQEAWFAENGLRLIRFTDEQFKQAPDDCLALIC